MSAQKAEVPTAASVAVVPRSLSTVAADQPDSTDSIPT